MNTSFFSKLLFTGFIIFLSTISNAQFSANYVPLKSSGALPEEFLRTAKSMSEEDIKLVGSGADKNSKQQFIVSSNYFLSKLLLSGDVLINDPLGNYVNKVADELLKNDPALRKQIHIYVIKSSEVNAYAFDKGFIFVNVGLLAQLENEAQLAYILGHEITHVVKKHSVNQYIEDVKLENGTSDYERGSYESRDLAKYRYSKENESEADAEGLIRIKESNYSVKALNGAFDVLQYSYLPFELVDFKKSFFEDQYLIMPDTLFLKKTSEIKTNDDYDDTKSTHPNIRKRRAAIESDLTVSDEAKRKKYIVSEEEFKKTRETARFEMCRLYLLERDYVNAIYGAYILLEKYPDNLYLKKTVAKALYNIEVNKSSASRNKNRYGNTDELSSKKYSIPDYEKIEGASQRLYYMLDNLDSKELNTIALSYTYKAHKANPSDALLSNLTDSLFTEMVNANTLYLNDFSRQSKSELKALDTIKTTPEIDTSHAEESKYSKIKKQQQKVEITTDENFTKYAFAGLLKDPEFEKRFTKAARGLTHSEPEKKSTLTYAEQKKLDKEKEKAFKDSYNLLGIEKVIFLDPFYMKVKNQSGNEVINYYESEDKQAQLTAIQKKCADKLKLGYETLTTKNLTASDIDKYNDNATINDWLQERFEHGNNNDAIIAGTEDANKLIEKYGSKYVAWGGVYNYKGRQYKNTYFFVLFNIETGEVMKFETRYTKAKDHADLITSFVYNSLMHVAKKNKS